MPSHVRRRGPRAHPDGVRRDPARHGRPRNRSPAAVIDAPCAVCTGPRRQWAIRPPRLCHSALQQRRITPTRPVRGPDSTLDRAASNVAQTLKPHTEHQRPAGSSLGDFRTPIGVRNSSRKRTIRFGARVRVSGRGPGGRRSAALVLRSRSATGRIAPSDLRRCSLRGCESETWNARHRLGRRSGHARSSDPCTTFGWMPVPPLTRARRRHPPPPTARYCSSGA